MLKVFKECATNQDVADGQKDRDTKNELTINKHQEPHYRKKRKNKTMRGRSSNINSANRKISNQQDNLKTMESTMDHTAEKGNETPFSSSKKRNNEIVSPAILVNCSISKVHGSN